MRARFQISLDRGLGLGLVLAAAALTGCGAAAAPAIAPAPPPQTVSSNLTRGDYAGSRACAGCHAAVYAAWEGSPMRSMTRLAESVPVEPVFDGRVFTYKDDRVTLLSHAGARHMRVERAGSQAVLYRVSKVIGGRAREDFVGTRLDGLELGAAPAAGAEERVLPVSYLLQTGALRYKGYSVMLPERPYLGQGAEWRKTCIVCHNTLPHLSTLYDDLIGAGAKTYFGTISDRLLPAERRVELHVTSQEGLRAALAAEMKALGAPVQATGETPAMLAETLRATRKKFGQEHLIEVGIGCEACHGGSREHVASPSRKPTFEPRSPFLSVTGKDGRPLSRAEQVNRVCARCHTVLFSGYKPTWEGGERPAGGADLPDAEAEASGAEAAALRAPGGSAINSGEARDFLLGGCASKMACTDCHDPHARDGSGDRRAKQLQMGRVCQSCHSQYKTPAAIAAHSHHRADGEGSDCLNCHMPRKNMGLDYKLTRYHRIGSPTDAARVLSDRPLECALCHENEPVGELVATMSAWWGKAYDRAALVALYGNDLGENALHATLSRGKPHEQAVAAAVLGQKKRRDMAARLVPVLSNEIPLVRYFAREALETMMGVPYPWDVGVGDPGRPDQALGWIAAHRIERD